MLTFTITADGTSAAQVLEGSERGPQTYIVRAFSDDADWESAVLTVKTSPPTANPPKYLPKNGVDALTEDGDYTMYAVRGDFVTVTCDSKAGIKPIHVEIRGP